MGAELSRLEICLKDIRTLGGNGYADWETVLARWISEVPLCVDEIPPDFTPPLCKDKRIWDVISNIMNDQLNGTRTAKADMLTRNRRMLVLLDATIRLLSVKGLFKCFINLDYHLVLAVLKIYRTEDFHDLIGLKALQAIKVSLDRTFCKSMVKYDRSEKANKTLFFSAGGDVELFAMIDTLSVPKTSANGERERDEKEVDRDETDMMDDVLGWALLILDSIIRVRQHTTESDAVQKVLDGIYERQATFFELSRHRHAATRRYACHLLRTLLLDSVPKRAEAIQKNARESGLLLWQFALSVDTVSAGYAATDAELQILSRELVAVLCLENAESQNVIGRMVPHPLMKSLKVHDRDRASIITLFDKYDTATVAAGTSATGGTGTLQRRQRTMSKEFHTTKLGKDMTARKFWFMRVVTAPMYSAGPGDLLTAKETSLTEAGRKMSLAVGNVSGALSTPMEFDCWTDFFEAFDSDHESISLIWNRVSREELRDALQNEVHDLDYLRARYIGRIPWDYEGFEVRYPSLLRELKVGGYYLRLLIPSLEDSSIPLTETLDAVMLINQLYDQCVVEDSQHEKFSCLFTLRGLCSRFPQASRDFKPIRYIIWLLRYPALPTLWRDQIFLLLKILFQYPENIKNFAQGSGLDALLPFLTKALVADLEAEKAGGHAADRRGSRLHDYDEGSVTRCRSISLLSTDGHDVFGNWQVAQLIIELLMTAVQIVPRLKQQLCEMDKLRQLVNVLLYKDQAITTQIIELLILVVASAPSAHAKLYKSGVFAFLLATSYSEEGMSLPAAEFCQAYHVLQEIDDTPTDCDMIDSAVGDDCIVPATTSRSRVSAAGVVSDDDLLDGDDTASIGITPIANRRGFSVRGPGTSRSVAARLRSGRMRRTLADKVEIKRMPDDATNSYLRLFLPQQLCNILFRDGAETFTRVFNSDDIHAPDVIWNYGMKCHLISAVKDMVAVYEAQLMAKLSRARFSLDMVRRISYEDYLGDQVCVGDVFLKSFVDSSNEFYGPHDPSALLAALSSDLIDTWSKARVALTSKHDGEVLAERCKLILKSCLIILKSNTAVTAKELTVETSTTAAVTGHSKSLIVFPANFFDPLFVILNNEYATFDGIPMGETVSASTDMLHKHLDQDRRGELKSLALETMLAALNPATTHISALEQCVAQGAIDHITAVLNREGVMVGEDGDMMSNAMIVDGALQVLPLLGSIPSGLTIFCQRPQLMRTLMQFMSLSVGTCYPTIALDACRVIQSLSHIPEICFHILNEGGILYLLSISIYFNPPATAKSRTRSISADSTETEPWSGWSSLSDMLMMATCMLRDLALRDTTDLLQQILTQLLTPGMYAMLMKSAEDFLTLARHPSVIHEPTLLWDDEMRDALFTCLEKEIAALSSHRGKLDTSAHEELHQAEVGQAWDMRSFLKPEGHRATYPMLVEEVMVADIYIRLFNERPAITFPKPTPRELVFALLDGIESQDAIMDRLTSIMASEGCDEAIKVKNAGHHMGELKGVVRTVTQMAIALHHLLRQNSVLAVEAASHPKMDTIAVLAELPETDLKMQDALLKVLLCVSEQPKGYTVFLPRLHLIHQLLLEKRLSSETTISVLTILLNTAHRDGTAATAGLMKTGLIITIIYIVFNPTEYVREARLIAARTLGVLVTNDKLGESVIKYVTFLCCPLFLSRGTHRNMLLEANANPEDVLHIIDSTFVEAKLLWTDDVKEDMLNYIRQEQARMKSLSMDDVARAPSGGILVTDPSAIAAAFKQTALEAEICVAGIFLRHYVAKPHVKDIDQAFVVQLVNRLDAEVVGYHKSRSSRDDAVSVENIELLWKALYCVIDQNSDLAKTKEFVAHFQYFFDSLRRSVPLRVQIAAMNVLCKVSKTADFSNLMTKDAKANTGDALIIILLGNLRSFHRAMEIEALTSCLRVITDLALRSDVFDNSFKAAGGFAYLLHVILDLAKPAPPIAGASAAVKLETALLVATSCLNVLCSGETYGLQLRRYACSILTLEFLNNLNMSPENLLRFIVADHSSRSDGRIWNASSRASLLSILSRGIEELEHSPSGAWDGVSDRWDLELLLSVWSGGVLPHDLDDSFLVTSPETESKAVSASKAPPPPIPVPHWKANRSKSASTLPANPPMPPARSMSGPSLAIGNSARAVVIPPGHSTLTALDMVSNRKSLSPIMFRDELDETESRRESDVLSRVSDTGSAKSGVI